MLRNLKQFNLPEIEEGVIKFWKESSIFEKTLKLREKSNVFKFFEGPPTANGLPHMGHAEGRIFKDVIPRYKTMRGFLVRRKAGWDTHGLPVELEVEKQLGLKSKKDIEKYGIAEFNKKCKESVWKYKNEWERFTERIGFWLDMKDPYVTYHAPYVESLWWIISQFARRKLLYKGFKIVNWCTRCGTGLSSHEMAQGYKEVKDNSVYIKFRVNKGQKIGANFVSDDNTYILSWTTTPWTLPGNVALAVGKNIEYSIIELNGSNLILATERISPVIKNEFKTKEKISGSNLIGVSYEPLFKLPKLRNDNSYKVYEANFVTTTDGTGVVHTAVMYGEDDYKLGIKVGLPEIHTVTEEGKFIKEVPGLEGLYVKAKETEKLIIEHLTRNNNFFASDVYTHEYPHCWRCDTPLLYYARSSWFVAMSKVKNSLIANNKKINWVPEYIKEGRFGEWLKEIKDWNFSRERYWGTPLPIWECIKCKRQEFIGSFDELHKKSSGANNQYWAMRHGQAETQLLNIIDSSAEDKYHLTDKGRKQVEKSAKELTKIFKKEKLDFIISSDILRTKETSEIVSKALGVKVIFDKRMREINVGVFSGGPDKNYHNSFPTLEEKFENKPERGESLRDLRTRLWELLQELESKHKNKKILLIGHDYPLWMLWHIAFGCPEAEAIEEKKERKGDFFKLAGFEELVYKIMPRNETGEIDPHRPYIDEIILPCSKCLASPDLAKRDGGKMLRVKELADVWFDSGSMPLAQFHYPFDKSLVKEKDEEKLKLKNIQRYAEFPADYISEGIDQTRGWFYTLLAVSTALGIVEPPYKNVITLGLVLDKNGQKMSKSKGNVVSPADMINKYGADVVRWYFYTINQPADLKRFDELDLGKILRKFILISYNSFIFFNTYAKKNTRAQLNKIKAKNILDKWVLMKLNKVIVETTDSLEKYDVVSAAKGIELFIDDLSRWYIRRSRTRLQKPEGDSDYKLASDALYVCLYELSKLLAPFAPFFAEALFQSLNNELGIMNNGRNKSHNSKFIIRNSVHLQDWTIADR